MSIEFHTMKKIIFGLRENLLDSLPGFASKLVIEDTIIKIECDPVIVKEIHLRNCQYLVNLALYLENEKGVSCLFPQELCIFPN